MAKFIYKAIKDGTLPSDGPIPYRRVRKGAIIRSRTEIKASWLESYDPNRPKQSAKPVLPYVRETVREKDVTPPAIDDPVYNRSIENLKKHEAARDAAAMTPEQKQEAIIKGIARLDPESEKDYTKGGKPDANVLREMLGFDVPAKDRDEAYDIYKSRLEGQTDATGTEGTDGTNGTEGSGDEGQGGTGDDSLSGTGNQDVI